MKTCKGCGELKGVDEFYPHPQMSDGHLNFCKVCIRQRAADRRASDPERARANDRARYQSQPARKAAPRIWHAKNTERARITRRNSQRVRRAVAKGVLRIPKACEQCRVRDVKLECAHYDYRYPLHVLWLCRPCHRKWDAARPKTVDIEPETPQQLHSRTGAEHGIFDARGLLRGGWDAPLHTHRDTGPGTSR